MSSAQVLRTIADLPVNVTEVSAVAMITTTLSPIFFSQTFLYPVCLFRLNSFSGPRAPPHFASDDTWCPLGPPDADSGQAGQMVYPVRSSPGPVTPGDGAKTVSWSTLREADPFVRRMREKQAHWLREHAITHHQGSQQF